MSEDSSPEITKSWVFVKDDDNNESPTKIIVVKKKKDENSDSDSDSISIISESGSSYHTKSDEDEINPTTKIVATITSSSSTTTEEVFQDIEDKFEDVNNEGDAIEEINSLQIINNQIVDNRNDSGFKLLAIFSPVILTILILLFSMIFQRYLTNNYTNFQKNYDFVANKDDNFLGDNNEKFSVPLNNFNQIKSDNNNNGDDDNNNNCKLKELKAKEEYLLQKEKFLIEKEHEIIKKELSIKNQKEYLEKQKRHEYQQDKHKIKQKDNKKYKNINNEPPKKGETYDKHHKHHKNNEKSKYNNDYNKFLNEKDDKKRNLTGLWYIDMNKGRSNIRKKEHASDWLFDRARVRTMKRNKAHWYFQWMLDRERLRLN